MEAYRVEAKRATNPSTWRKLQGVIQQDMAELVAGGKAELKQAAADLQAKRPGGGMLRSTLQDVVQAAVMNLNAA